jgi:hypothetical protein
MICIRNYVALMVYKCYDLHKKLYCTHDDMGSRYEGVIKHHTETCKGSSSQMRGGGQKL